MPSHDLNLSPEEIPHFRPMRGHALLRVLPTSLSTPSGLLHLPETHAVAGEQAEAVRRGVVVRVNYQDSPYYKPHVPLVELYRLTAGVWVYYLGHGDEMAAEYVVVAHGQIIAIEP